MRGRGGEAGRRATGGARGGAAPFGCERGRAGGKPPRPLPHGSPRRAPRPPAPPTSLPQPRDGGTEEAPPGPPGTAPPGAARPLSGTGRAGPGRSRSRRRSPGVRALKGARPLSPRSGPQPRFPSAGCAWCLCEQTSVAVALHAEVTRTRQCVSTWPSVCVRARAHTHACSFAASFLVGPVLFPLNSINTPVNALWY